MSEFANSGRYSESPWGQVWNAIQPSSTAQGSSGGSAAAIAASFAAFGMGSQTGVSLYAPSAAEGLVSLRGTDGMSSGSGVAPLTFLQDYAGALARTTTDLAKILNVTTGTDPDDPGTVQGDADNKRPKDWTTALDPDALKGAKIGIISSQYTTPSYGTQGSIDRYNVILDQLEALGVQLVEMTGSVAAPANVPGNLGNEGWFEWIRTHPNSPYATPAEIINSPKKLPYNRSTNSTAVDMTDAQVQAARDRRTAYKANWKTYLDANGVDAVLYPGNTSDFSDNDTAALGASFGSPPTSNIGIPGMVVPVGLNDHGHPLSMQFVGRAWDDAKMLGFGYALEQLVSSAIVPIKLPKLRYDATATPKPIEIEPLPLPETKAPEPASEPTPPTVPATVPSGTTAAKPPFLARRFTATVKRAGAMTFTTSGSILLPSGLTRAAACTGSVRVIVKAGNRTLSTRRVPLSEHVHVQVEADVRQRHDAARRLAPDRAGPVPGQRAAQAADGRADPRQDAVGRRAPAALLQPAPARRPLIFGSYGSVGVALGFAPAPPARKQPARRLRWPLLVGGGLVVLAAALRHGRPRVVGRDAHERPVGARAGRDRSPSAARCEQATAADSEGRAITLVNAGGRLTPAKPIAPGAKVTIDVVTRRPGWNAWLVGKTSRQRCTVTAPFAQVTSAWVTKPAGEPVPVTLQRADRPRRLRGPHGARDGTLAGDPGASARRDGARRGRRAPVGAGRPGRHGPLLPARQAAGRARQPGARRQARPGRPAAPHALRAGQARCSATRLPKLSPSVPGHWKRSNAHTLVFTPSGTGPALGSTSSSRSRTPSRRPTPPAAAPRPRAS